MKYIVTFCAKEKEKHLNECSWWNFWSKPKLVEREYLNRKTIVVEGYSEKEVLSFFENPLFTDTLKQLYKEPCFLQVERGEQPTPYIETT